MGGDIYIIKNIINHKCYIGQTIQNWERRIKCHFWEANRLKGNKKATKLNNAINKYSINNFVWNIVCNCENEFLNIKEIFYIKVFNSYYDGYNSTLGGQGSYGNKMSEQTKNKIRIFQINHNKD